MELSERGRDRGRVCDRKRESEGGDKNIDKERESER